MQGTAGVDLDALRKEQRLNRVDLGAKDDGALTFAVIAHDPTSTRAAERAAFRAHYRQQA